LSATSFLILLNRFRVGRSDWNTKTRDYWYALTMWTFAASCGTIESLIRGLSIRYSIVLSIAAAATTLSGVLRKGTWGGEDRHKQ
jgi:hypothetical protein